jgi:hypothetical protein
MMKNRTVNIDGVTAWKLSFLCNGPTFDLQKMIDMIVADWIGPRVELFIDAPCQKKKDAVDRLAILSKWKAMKRPAGGMNGFSRTTLYRWELLVQGGGISALVDRRGGGQPGDYSDLIAAVRRHLVRHPRNFAAAFRAAVSDVTKRHQRAKLASYKTIRRAFKRGLNHPESHAEGVSKTQRIERRKAG